MAYIDLGSAMKKPAIFMQSPMVQVADKSQPPIINPTVDEPFYAAIGALIAQWSVMEQQLNVLVTALLEHNGTTELGWRTRPFERRFELLQGEWTKFSKGSTPLGIFLDRAYSKVRGGKVLRDSISHKEIVLGIMPDGNNFIQFYHQQVRAKQKSKPYYRADFISAAGDARDAAGWFYWVCDPESLWPLPSPDAQRLRSLPNTDHLRIPT